VAEAKKRLTEMFFKYLEIFGLIAFGMFIGWLVFGFPAHASFEDVLYNNNIKEIDVTDEEVKDLVARYEIDSCITYKLSGEELFALLNSVGEMEPIIDAINVLNGASVEQRAADIGCDVEDFFHG
jgi:hypothetical protein